MSSQSPDAPAPAFAWSLWAEVQGHQSRASCLAFGKFASQQVRICGLADGLSGHRGQKGRQPAQLSSVPTGVYAFGFLFMLPQLFVNYKVRPARVC